MSYGILLVRVVVGLTMASHGAQKLLGWFNGPGLKGTAGFFGQLNYRAPALMAVMAALAETSGLLFALGLLTPLAALGITVVMLNAIGAVHWRNGFFNSDGGFEFPLTMAAVAVAVAASGPGRFSIDQAIGWADNSSGLWWGVAVVAAALLSAALTLTLGRKRTPAVAVGLADEQPASDEALA